MCASRPVQRAQRRTHAHTQKTKASVCQVQRAGKKAHGHARQTRKRGVHTLIKHAHTSDPRSSGRQLARLARRSARSPSKTCTQANHRVPSFRSCEEEQCGDVVCVTRPAARANATQLYSSYLGKRGGANRVRKVSVCRPSLTPVSRRTPCIPRVASIALSAISDRVNPRGAAPVLDTAPRGYIDRMSCVAGTAIATVRRILYRSATSAWACIMSART